jgi:hypothetical protein
MTNSEPIKLRRGQHRTVGSRMRPFQKKAIELFTQQALAGVYKPIEETLLQAGYSAESARQISNVLAGIRPHVDPIVERLEAHRDRVLTKMEDGVEQATYGELVRSLDITIRNARLLGGKSTHNLSLMAEHRHRLDELLD